MTEEVQRPTPDVDGNPFDEWLEKYQYNVIDFAREVLGFVPDESLDPEESHGQIDIILAYQDRIRAIRDALPIDGTPPAEAVLAELVRQISAVSGHGVGKTAGLAICINHHICVFFPQRVVCTSATEKQLFNALASEVKAWMKKLPPALLELFDITAERIVLKAAPEESYVAFQTSSKENTEALAGVHSKHVLLIVDEASGVADATFEAASGSMSDYRAVLILTGNPVRNTGFFADACNKRELAHRWVRLHLDCRYSPRVSPTWIREMAEKYGEESNAFRVRVLGLFPLRDDETFMSREVVQAAVNREVALVPVASRIWGVDCARFGRDKTAVVMRHGNHILDDIFVWGGLDTMQIVGRIKHLYDTTPQNLKPQDIL
ncbi:MAG TPA: hypothetical protein VLG10_08135, partial [Methylomirabilota bacterium]|nr:hypothetical protein [Methylomirabilota bacterium]